MIVFCRGHLIAKVEFEKKENRGEKEQSLFLKDTCCKSVQQWYPHPPTPTPCSQLLCEKWHTYINPCSAWTLASLWHYGVPWQQACLEATPAAWRGAEALYVSFSLVFPLE